MVAENSIEYRPCRKMSKKIDNEMRSPRKTVTVCAGPLYDFPLSTLSNRSSAASIEVAEGKRADISVGGLS